jgi:hypothetical protein
MFAFEPQSVVKTPHKQALFLPESQVEHKRRRLTV